MRECFEVEVTRRVGIWILEGEVDRGSGVKPVDAGLRGIEGGGVARNDQMSAAVMEAAETRG